MASPFRVSLAPWVTHDSLFQAYLLDPRGSIDSFWLLYLLWLWFAFGGFYEKVARAESVTDDSVRRSKVYSSSLKKGTLAALTKPSNPPSKPPTIEPALGPLTASPASADAGAEGAVVGMLVDESVEVDDVVVPAAEHRVLSRDKNDANTSESDCCRLAKALSFHSDLENSPEASLIDTPCSQSINGKSTILIAAITACYHQMMLALLQARKETQHLFCGKDWSLSVELKRRLSVHSKGVYGKGWPYSADQLDGSSCSSVRVSLRYMHRLVTLKGLTGKLHTCCSTSSGSETQGAIQAFTNNI